MYRHIQTTIPFTADADKRCVTPCSVANDSRCGHCIKDFL